MTKGTIMTDHHTRGLTLEDVQTIIGRGILDEAFRKEFVNDPEEVVNRLGISLDQDGEAKKLLAAIGGVFAGETDLKSAMQDIKQAYEDTSDGVIRPRCA
ncbi:MAG: hypothetical protein ACWA49_01840 [Ruegeria sp.]